jgi:nucleotide-binding universal stress UspA family protein
MPLPPTDTAPYPTRILCPTDFSPVSRRARAYAIALARRARAEITFLHVCPLPLPSVVDDEGPDWMPNGPSPTTRLTDELRTFAEPARAAGLRTELMLRDGVPGEEIVRAACSLDRDLIVMGSHGRRGLHRILGSHAEHVVRTASCPVLTVSAGVEGEREGAAVRIGRILCAAGASEHSPTTIAYAWRLAAGAGARLTIVHVSDPRHRTQVAVPSAAGPLAPAGVSREERVTSGAPSSEILRSARECSADLIVVGTHRRGPATLGLLGSTYGQVLGAAKCGVLAVGSVDPAGRAHRAGAERSAVASGQRGSEVEHGGAR